MYIYFLLIITNLEKGHCKLYKKVRIGSIVAGQAVGQFIRTNK
jgi:hypothetical protein